MNLEEYINQNPNATLADVHAYSEVTKRMMTSKTMGIVLDNVGLYLIIHEIAAGEHDIPILDESNIPTGEFTNHPAKSHCLLIVSTLQDGSADGGDFNFMQGTYMGDGVIAKTLELRDVTLVEYKPQIQALLDYSLAHCNQTTYPFINVTQTEFDKVKLEINPTYQEVNTYVDKNFTQAHLVKGRQSINHMLEVTVGTALPFADTIMVYAATKATDETNYVKLSQAVGVLQIPADHAEPLKVKLNKSLLEPHTKYYIQSKYNRAITAHAYTVG